MAMNPRTHPRGTRPNFALPAPNPNPTRMTNALWWLVCMRLALEPQGRNGGTFANKDGYHNAGENLDDHGLGDPRTDHSIRRAPDRSGPWWENFSSAHDWTFVDAQAGNYATINKYTKRLVNAMKDPDDLRPDDVYAYTLGQVDGDTIVEGYNEYTNDPETSADETHLWHRHDSFRRNIIGDYWAVWKALTIDMGWTYDEWLASTQTETKDWSDMATKAEIKTALVEVLEEAHALPGNPGERLRAAGWSNMSDRQLATYAFENLLNVSAALRAFVDYEKADDDERDAALARLEAATGRIEVALTEAPGETA